MHPPATTIDLALNAVTTGYYATPVIRDISLTIARGERLALLGPNGAGKSTLFRAINGLLKLHRGDISICGHPQRTLSAPLRARLLATVPQELDTAMPFTAGELVMMGRSAVLSRWAAPSAEDRHWVEDAMRMTDTTYLAPRRFHEMSGGERQRVAIAMALSARPQIILLDEPTSHLDMNHRLETLQLIERLNLHHGMTILMIGHDLNLAAEYFPRLLLMQNGAIIADGPPETVLTADRLGQVYGCRVAIHRDPLAGVLRVFPRRKKSE